MNIFSLALFAAGVVSAHECGKCAIDINVCTACKATATPCPAACTPSCTPCAAPMPVVMAPRVSQVTCSMEPAKKPGFFSRLFSRSKKVQACGSAPVTMVQPTVVQARPCTTCAVAQPAPCTTCVAQPAPAVVTQPIVVRPVIVQQAPVTTCRTTTCTTGSACNSCGPIVTH